jgi:hypothetical protein
MDLIHKAATYGPFIDGRTVDAYGYPGLPSWAWESLLIRGEPGTVGPYMTLPRAAPPDHSWLKENREHPMIQRYGR